MKRVDAVTGRNAFEIVDRQTLRNATRTVSVFK